MSELALLVIIIAFSFAIYYLTKVSTKETSFEKVLEEQRQSQISIVNITSQKQKKPKKRKKKTDDESLKKENSSRVTARFEEKAGSKILPNKENDKRLESKLLSKKELENNSKCSEETSDVKEKPVKKDEVSANKSSEETFIMGKKIINSKIKPKGVEKIKKNNAGVDNFCISNDTKSIENQEQNKPSKSKCSYNSNNIEKQKQISDNIEKQKQANALKEKHRINSDSVKKHEQNKPLKSKHIDNSNSVEKLDQNMISKPSNNSSTDNVTKIIPKPNSSTEIINKGAKNKAQQKIGEIKDNNQKAKKTSLDIVEHITEVNEHNSVTAKDTKKKVGNNSSALVDISYSKLKHIIQKSQYTGLEIQFLIEMLLNKQVAINTGGEWIEKGKIATPISQLQRQLDEYKSKFSKESDTNNALLAKISSLRNDLNSERSRSKSFQEELKSSSALLQQKLNELSTTHKEKISLLTNEITKKLHQDFQLKLTQKEEHLKAESEINIQKYKSNLADMERQLQQLQSAHQSSELNCEKVKNLLSETQHQLNNLSQEREKLLQTCQTYQQHVTNIKEQTSEHEMSLRTHLYEAQQKLKTSEASELQRVSEMHQLSEEKEILEKKLRSYESAREIFSQNQIKLEKIVEENQELENQVQTFESDIYNLHELLRNKELEIHRLKEENNEISTRFRPVTNTKENGVHPNSFSPGEIICSCCKLNLTSKEDENHIAYETSKSLANGVKTPSTKKKETSSDSNEEKIKIVEKIIEKVIQDPLTLEQLQETRKENDKMKIKIESLNEEKRLLEENLKKETALLEQNKLVQDLQIENENLAEKVNNYQLILSNTESLLKTLQKSVETEEHTWREKLLQNEEALQQLSVEKENLSLEVQQLRRSLQNVESEKIESELNLIKEKLELETKTKLKLKEELVSVQEQLKSAYLHQFDRYGTPDGTLQNEKDTDSIASSQDQNLLQPEKKKKKNGRLAANE